MPSVRIARIDVEIEGEGDPVLLLHGLGGTSSTFTLQVPALVGRYRLIRPDLPGSGRSAVPEGDLSIATLVTAMLRLMAELRLPPVHVIAHSLGTIVAQHLAVAEPALVRSLALLGALAEPTDPARRGLRDRAAQARAEGMGGIADAVAQASLAAATRTEAPAAIAFVRESLMRQPAEGYARTCEALAAARAAPASAIRRPTLLLTGADDPIAPPSIARALAERIEGARAEILPRCGHWAGIERSREVNAALASFYSRGIR